MFVRPFYGRQGDLSSQYLSRSRRRSSILSLGRATGSRPHLPFPGAAMPKLSEGLETGLEIVLVSYKEEYTRVVNAWKDLETKAAGVTTIAGIFLGFVLNYIKDTHDQMDTIQQLLSGATLLLLLFTLTFSLASVVIRERVRPPDSSSINAAVTDLYLLQDETAISAYVIRILKDQIRDWDAAVKNRVLENTTKAKHVQRAQFLLIISMFLAAVLAGSTLLS
jgi:hypothetical protein